MYGEYVGVIDIRTLEMLEGDLPSKVLDLVSSAPSHPRARQRSALASREAVTKTVAVTQSGTPDSKSIGISATAQSRSGSSDATRRASSAFAGGCSRAARCS